MTADKPVVLFYRPVVRRDGNCRLGFGAHMTSSPDPRDSDWRSEESRQWVKATDYAAAIARAEAAEGKVAAMEQYAREIYALIPGLPVTPETCDAATDVLTQFCIDFHAAIAAQQADGVRG